MTDMNKEDTIYVVAQQFCGNRTGTSIERARIDHFLRGHMSDIFGPKDVEDVVLKTVRVPGSDKIVIVYDQTQEEEYVNVEFPEIYAMSGASYKERWGEELKMPVSCEIPEIGFKIHTRCIACRMDENGVLQSLEKDDFEKFLHYFPEK